VEPHGHGAYPTSRPLRGDRALPCRAVSPIRQRMLLAALLAAGTLAVFAAVRGFDFVEYDDAIYVTQNPHLEKGLSQAGLRWAFTPYEANWIPLTWLSLLVDHELWGKQPAGYHVTNLVLHVL